MRGVGGGGGGSLFQDMARCKMNSSWTLDSSGVNFNCKVRG